MVAEIVGNIIPNQRIDRIARFLEILDKKVGHIEHEVLKAKMSAPGFVDLLEEAFFQAARAASDERKEQIATLVKNGLTQKQITLLETQKLLSLLGQLNDAEVIFLRWRGFGNKMKEERAFFEKHQSLLWPKSTGTDRDIDRDALREGYSHHLVALGLYRPRFSQPHPQMKGFSLGEESAKRPTGYEITDLGRLLLRYIDSR